MKCKGVAGLQKKHPVKKIRNNAFSFFFLNFIQMEHGPHLDLQLAPACSQQVCLSAFMQRSPFFFAVTEQLILIENVKRRLAVKSAAG